MNSVQNIIDNDLQLSIDRLTTTYYSAIYSEKRTLHHTTHDTYREIVPDPTTRAHHKYQNKSIMDEIMNALKNIQKELDDQRTEIRKSGENVTKQVTLNINKILDERFAIWEGKHEKLKEKIENQEKRIYFLEKQARQRNIVFFGLEEKEKSYDNLQDIIINFINERFTTKLESRDIQEIKRIGKPGERPRPVIVTFATLGIKINIFKQKVILKDTQYYMKEDFPQQVLVKRRELQEQAKIEKEKGNIVKIKYDKLVVAKPNYKRPLSSPPTSYSQPQAETSTHAKKKNKTLKESSIRRSNSITEGVLKPNMLNFLVNKNPNNTTRGQDTENGDNMA